MIISIPVSIGELLDKLSILHIKMEKIEDPTKLGNIKKEYDYLSSAVYSSNIDYEDQLTKLKKVNSTLWEIEDKLRVKEKAKDFGSAFVELARQVYIFNDERFKIKTEINRHHDSEVKEEKSYEDYS